MSKTLSYTNRVTSIKIVCWYLAFQDGRAEGDREYYSKEEAERALLKYGDQARGMYVVGYERELMKRT